MKQKVRTVLILFSNFKKTSNCTGAPRLDEKNKWNILQKFENIYPGVFQGIDSYLNVIGSVQSFVIEQNLQVVPQKGDGHCFINCLRQYFAERFDLLLSVEEFGSRVKNFMKADISYLTGFMPGLGFDHVNAQLKLNLMHKTYFEKKIFRNGFTDVLINTCARYFGFRLLIVEERDCFNTHLIPVSNIEKINLIDGYQHYSGDMIVVMRSGNYDEDLVFTSHYDLLLPNTVKIKYQINNESSITKKQSNSEIVIKKI